MVPPVCQPRVPNPERQAEVGKVPRRDCVVRALKVDEDRRPEPESSPPFKCAPQHRSRSRYRHCRTRSTTGCAQSKPHRGLPREFAAAAAKVAIWFLRAAALFPAPPSAVGVSVDRDAMTATAPEASWRSSRKPPEAPRWRATSTGESGGPRRWWNGNRVSGGGEGVKTVPEKAICKHCKH